MSVYPDPTPSERVRFVTSLLEGIDPSTAARNVGQTATRFRRLANHDPSFARAYRVALLLGGHPAPSLIRRLERAGEKAAA